MTKEFEKFMGWVLDNVESSGYVWYYNGEYYTSKQLFVYWKNELNKD